jgi:hypothetical protein
MIKRSDFKKTLLWKEIDQKNELLIFDEVYSYEGQSGTNDLKMGNGREYTPTSGEKIYFMPGCTVPRTKIKGYCEKHKISVVKSADKADILFFGPKTVKELLKEYYMIKVKKEAFRREINKLYAPGSNKYVDLNNKIDDCESDWILVNSHLTYAIRGGHYYYNNAYNWTTIKTEVTSDEYISGHMFVVPDDNKMTFLEKILNKGSSFIEQDCILKDINDTIMDRDMYISLAKMLKSSEDSNHIVAMEVMANCDYEKSAVYLLLLLKDYGRTIARVRSRTYVNFQSMLNFFGLRTSYTYVTLDNIVRILFCKELLTPENTDILMPLAKGELGDSANTTYFKVATVELVTPEPGVEDEEEEELEEEEVEEDENS